MRIVNYSGKHKSPWPAGDRAHRRPGPTTVGLRGPARADLGDHRLPSRQFTAHLRAASLGAIADLGFVGLDDSGPDADPAVITGYKAARNLSPTRGQKLSNKALAAVRVPVEHGFAHLKNWRVLGKVRTDPTWATALVRALLVLTNKEIAR
ncbi:transposase family protein [Streptomyces sp. WMMB303]|nr:transposase family protein [Streptomyces sp. WMMB303]MDF4252786.1 transposase family protein [Streptomyces sp. WMMB303]